MENSDKVYKVSEEFMIDAREAEKEASELLKARFFTMTELLKAGFVQFYYTDGKKLYFEYKELGHIYKGYIIT